MNKTIAVIGAGPGIGLAVARKFGQEGFNVALIARNAQTLNGFATALKAEGIDAESFPADAGVPEQLIGALKKARARFGQIDVLEYGPKPEAASLVTPRQITVANARLIFDRIVAGAITAVGEVLPGMLERRDGALLFTGAASGIHPVLFSSNFAISVAGLRNYAQSLYVDLANEGIYSGMATIAGLIVEGDTERKKNLAAEARRPGDRGWEEYRAFHEDLAARLTGADVADTLWDMYVKRDRAEVVMGDPEICHRLNRMALQSRQAA